MANPIQFDSYKPAKRPDCLACEEMLADAVDGLLSPADQAFFDRHTAGCVDCVSAFADAKRGVAWLDMLKAPRPEPSAHLLERILAQTSGLTSGTDFEQTLLEGTLLPVVPALLEPVQPPALPANVVPFRPRVSRLSRWTHLMLEPRLAMTAAMAFFSIALTMNLAGVRLDQLHASDLKPENLTRTWYQTTAAASRRYESLRVVHVVEARLSDLRDAHDNEEDRLGGLSERPESRRDLPAAPDTKPQADEPAKSKPEGSTPEGVSRREQPTPNIAAPRKKGGLA